MDLGFLDGMFTGLAKSNAAIKAGKKGWSLIGTRQQGLSKKQSQPM